MNKFKALNSSVQLDPQSLRAFYYAAQFENFTKAALATHLTQSGVSQHAASLEELLKVNLFVRVGKTVKLSEAGEELKNYAESYFDGVHTLLDRIGQVSLHLSGKVSYAMPASCLKTPHFPLLLIARKDFKGIDLKIHICHSEEVLEKLIAGEIDFGFMTKSIPHKDVEQLEFAREDYVLVGSDRKMMNDFDPKMLNQVSFVNYPGAETLFSSWARNQNLRAVHFHELTFSGEINDLSGAITMCEYGLGISIFPKHCVQDLLDEKKLFVAKNFDIAKEKNPIFLVKLKHQKTLARVQTIIDEFMKMKK